MSGRGAQRNPGDSCRRNPQCHHGPQHGMSRHSCRVCSGTDWGLGIVGPQRPRCRHRLRCRWPLRTSLHSGRSHLAGSISSLLRRARAAVLGRARAPEAAACLLAGCPLPGRRPLAVAGGDRTYTRATSGPAGVHPLMPSLSWRVGGAGFSGSL